MNKRKQFLFTLTGILLICTLFSTAMIFPKYFNLYRDSRILNKTEYINVNNDMYEVSYTSFADKLNAIARCRNFGNELHSVKINDTGFHIDSKSINKIIKKEFNTLFELGAVCKKIKPTAKKMASCETYALYASDNKNGIKGIVYRKIVYNMKKGKITVYFDEEYHKIYEMILPISLYFPKNTSVSYSQTYKENPTPKTIYDTDNYSNLLYATIDGFFYYYDVTGSIQKSMYQLEPNYIGIVSFHDDSALTIEGSTFYDSPDSATDETAPNDSSVSAAGSKPAKLSNNLYIKIGINWGDIQ